MASLEQAQSWQGGSCPVCAHWSSLSCLLGLVTPIQVYSLTAGLVLQKSPGCQGFARGERGNAVPQVSGHPGQHE